MYIFYRNPGHVSFWGEENLKEIKMPKPIFIEFSPTPKKPVSKLEEEERAEKDMFEETESKESKLGGINKEIYKQ